MSNEEPPVSNALLEQAARFRARAADAPNDAALAARIARWNAESPAHADASREAELLWQLMGSGAIAARNRRRVRTWLIPAAGVAAVLTVMLSIPAVERRFDYIRSDVVAEVGQHRDVTLADGSRVALNADTALAWNADRTGRNVRLFRGEAFFSVAHDRARPFRISAGDATVTVVGTRFNVRMADKAVIVTVAEGRVKLDGPAGERFLTREEQGVVENGRVTAQVSVAADATAWQRGRAVYYDAPLPSVIADLNRARSGTIYLMTGATRDRRVTGAFRTDTPDASLNALVMSLKLRSLSLPGGLVFLY